jgi:hypothetical protein
MSDTTHDIEIPRLDGETSAAYAARLAYLVAGPNRSLAKICGQVVGNSRVSNRLGTLETWSSRFHWADSARRYDDHVASLMLQQAAQAHREAIEQHRIDAMDLSGRLLRLGRDMIDALGAQVDALEYKPADLSAAVKALVTGLDIRAHALDLPRLLASIEVDTDDD